MTLTSPSQRSGGRVLWLPLALTVLALAVRLYRIGAESIWLDEATSLFLARMDVRGIIAWTGADVHPPLYYALLHVWRAFGEGEAWLRGLSALAGVASVPVLFALGRELWDEWTGAGAALVLALGPLAVWYSQQVRMYTWLGLWVLLASYLLVRALCVERWGWWAAYAVVMALAFYTHYYSSLGLVFHGLVVLLQAPHRRKAIVSWMAALAGAALLFLPWAPTMWFQISSGGGGWVAEAGRPDLRTLLDTFVAYTVGPAQRLLPVWGRRLAYALAVALLGLAAWQSLRKSRALARRRPDGIVFSALYVAAPLGLSWLVSQAKPMYAERYLLPFLPGFCLLLGRGFTAAPRLWGRRAMAAFWPALMLVALWQLGATAQNDDFRSAASYMRTSVQAGDVVVYYPGWNDKPIEYYLQPPVPSVTQFPVPITKDQVAGFVEPGLVGYDRAWLVWSVGHYGDRAGNVKQYLDDHYRLVESCEFIGPIGVALYDLGGP